MKERRCSALLGRVIGEALEAGPALGQSKSQRSDRTLDSPGVRGTFYLWNTVDGSCF
jgi:hypothetical protein